MSIGRRADRRLYALPTRRATPPARFSPSWMLSSGVAQPLVGLAKLFEIRRGRPRRSAKPRRCSTAARERLRLARLRPRIAGAIPRTM